MTYQDYIFAVTLFGFIGCTWFVVAYLWSVRGIEGNEVRRFLLAVYINLALLFVYIMAGPFMVHWSWRRWVAGGLYTAYALEAWWPLRLLYITQKRKRVDSG